MTKMIYSFIYWTNEGQEEGTEKEKLIKASSLKKACKKFIKKVKKAVIVDYEVNVEIEEKDFVQDISDFKSINHLLK